MGTLIGVRQHVTLDPVLRSECLTAQIATMVWHGVHDGCKMRQTALLKIPIDETNYRFYESHPN